MVPGLATGVGLAPAKQREHHAEHAGDRQHTAPAERTEQAPVQALEEGGVDGVHAVDHGRYHFRRGLSRGVKRVTKRLHYIILKAIPVARHYPNAFVVAYRFSQ